MIYYAHRGASGEYPENTMLAFTKAIEMGADGIETDVQMSADGQLVLCHDETIDRTTDGKGRVVDMTWEELQKYDAGSWFAEVYAGQRLPLLRELLTLAAAYNIGLNLELKNYIVPYEDMERKVIAEVEQHFSTEKVILSSFSHPSMVKTKRLFPHVKTGLLYCCDLYRPGPYAITCQADALHPDYTTLTKEGVREAHEFGLSVNAYTVNEPEELRQMEAIGVDIVITNYPDRRPAV